MTGPEAYFLGVPAVGYQVRTADGHEVIGIVESVSGGCARVDKIPGYPGRVGYVPEPAVALIDPAIQTIRLRSGIEAEDVMATPRPDAAGATAEWHMSDDWWADLLGHFGLYTPEGRGNEPMLHPDQR